MPVSEPNGLKNLEAILEDQPHLNSVLTVAQIRRILKNAGGFMPDEAALWFRATYNRTAPVFECPDCGKDIADDTEPHAKDCERAASSDGE